MQGFLTRLQLSEPSKSLLHSKWLGTSIKQSKYDPPVFGFTLRTHSLVANRAGDEIAEKLRLMRVGEFSVEAICTQWPPLWMSHVPSSFDDPNAGFVAVEVEADGAEVCERVEIVRLLLESMPKLKKRQSDGTTNQSFPIPRIELNLRVNLISVRLLHPSPTGLDLACVSLQTRGFNIRASSAFRQISSVPDPFVVEYGRKARLMFDFAFLLEPLSIKADSDASVQSAMTPEDQSWTASSTFPTISPASSFITLSQFSTPVLTLSGIEVLANGDLTTNLLEDMSHSIISTAAEMRWITDEVFVDLSQPDSIAILAAVIQHIHIEDYIDAPASTTKPAFDRLPQGWTFYMSVPIIRVAVAGRGINPGDVVPASRGLALRTSLIIRYNFFDTLSLSITQKASNTQHLHRNRLGLEVDMTADARAHANAVRPVDGYVAMLQVLFKKNSIRCIVNDEGYGWQDAPGTDHPFTAGQELDAHLLLRSPVMEAVVFLHRRQGSNIEGLKFMDTCDIKIRVPQLFSRFDLHHVYCAMTAITTIKALSPSRPYAPKGRKSRTASGLLTTINFLADNLQVIAVFPLGSRLFLRLEGIGYEKTDRADTVRCKSATAWVPSMQQTGQWEELACMLEWSLKYEAARHSAQIRIAGKAVRVRIPYEFILSALISDITITAKSAKHLLAMVATGRYFPMPKPPIEPAKRVPGLLISVGCITVEAVDSPFESRLNLIWRTGFDEQRARRDREIAFAAKVEAIRAAEAGERPIEAMSSMGIQGGVSAAHTISIEDAQARLHLYNSGSWIRR